MQTVRDLRVIDVDPVDGSVKLDGKLCRYHVSRKAISVRIDDQVCIAHHLWWMDLDEAREVARAILAVTDPES